MQNEQKSEQIKQLCTTCLTEIESKEILRKAGIPVIETKMATTRKEAVNLSKKIGFPVVLKIVSPDIVHKSDFGGVKLGLKNCTQVSSAYGEIISSVRQKMPQARVRGVAVQKMAKPGVEIIIGMSKDAQFGPMLMFGLGGFLVEVLKDVSFRLVPVTSKDAKEMIEEIKAYPILHGYRGDPVDVRCLQQLLLKTSKLVERCTEIEELDINPIFAYKKGAVAVDARVILKAAGKG
jgi:acyl-CoA synthetase (NDP forming)